TGLVGVLSSPASRRASSCPCVPDSDSSASSGCTGGDRAGCGRSSSAGSSSSRRKRPSPLRPGRPWSENGDAPRRWSSWIVGDPERLATAVDNLLQNAVKFSAGPPEIEVTGDRADGLVRLVVKDHGIGIPAAARSRLFEKFYRVNDPELNNVAGTGIGLYLVRQVVEGHGGRVDVASQPGQGSAFEIDLPYALEGATAPAEPSLP